MSFKLTKERKIVLLFCGLENQKHKTIKIDLQKYFSIVEIDYFGGNDNKHRGQKHFQTEYGETYKYLSHKEIDNKKGRELVIYTKNDVLSVETHFQFYKETKAFSSYNIVKNISKTQLFLTYVSSFHQLGVMPANGKNTFLYECINSWQEEAQWRHHKLFDLGIYSANGFTSMKRYSLNNTGSWSTKEHLPMLVLEDKKKNHATLIQIENNGSWHLEIGDYLAHLYISASGPEYNDNQWIKKLEPNEVFESCRATISYGKDFEETIQEITKARRSFRRHSPDLDDIPVIFNDYMHALWD